MHTYSGGANAAVQRCKGASSVIAIAEDQALVQSGSFRFTSSFMFGNRRAHSPALVTMVSRPSAISRSRSQCS
jgi:hypothetical protein